MTPALLKCEEEKAPEKGSEEVMTNAHEWSMMLGDLMRKEVMGDVVTNGETNNGTYKEEYMSGDEEDDAGGAGGQGEP